MCIVYFGDEQSELSDTIKYTRPTSVCMMDRFLFQNTIAAGSNETHIFNLAKLMSSVNRKSYSMVHENGRPMEYGVNIQVFGTDAEALVGTAPNTYVTQSAVERFANARKRMYERAGISMSDLGPYGREFRPYLSVDHRNGVVTEIAAQNAAGLGITPHFQGDEWTYSVLGVATPMNEASANADLQKMDLVDLYEVSILGTTEIEGGLPSSDADKKSESTDYDSAIVVGMVDQWLDSFKRRPLTTSGEAIDSNNYLLQLEGEQSPAKEEVLEIVKENQQEGRPWDADGSAYKDIHFNGYARSFLAGSNAIGVATPCGLLQLSLANNHSAQETIKVVLEVAYMKEMDV